MKHILILMMVFGIGFSQTLKFDDLSLENDVNLQKEDLDIYTVDKESNRKADFDVLKTSVNDIEHKKEIIDEVQGTYEIYGDNWTDEFVNFIESDEKKDKEKLKKAAKNKADNMLGHLKKELKHEGYEVEYVNGNPYSIGVMYTQTIENIPVSGKGAFVSMTPGGDVLNFKINMGNYKKKTKVKKTKSLNSAKANVEEKAKKFYDELPAELKNKGMTVHKSKFQYIQNGHDLIPTVTYFISIDSTGSGTRIDVPVTDYKTTK